MHGGHRAHAELEAQADQSGHEARGRGGFHRAFSPRRPQQGTRKRPRRDLNPCYQRERLVSLAKLDDGVRNRVREFMYFVIAFAASIGGTSSELASQRHAKPTAEDSKGSCGHKIAQRLETMVAFGQSDGLPRK